MAIDIISNLVDNDDNVVVCKGEYNIGKLLLTMAAIVAFLVTIILGALCAKYAISTKTGETIYNSKLRRITSNYSSYIQRIVGQINFDDYQILKVEKFVDILEIRDTIQQPILMIENKEDKVTQFMIINKNKILYFYELSAQK